MTTMSFSQLGVPQALVSTLSKMGIDTPFPIQIDTLPDTLSGRDVLGRGKTGSGKTLAFSIPMVARLAGELSGGKRRSGRPLGLVLAPTRELATQITNVMKPLAEAVGLRVTTIFGGVSQNRQVQALRDGVDIVVATPGRLEDLKNQKLLHLDAIEITVLDEADHMADLGFLPVVTKILSATPAGGQRLLFSATLDNGVNKLVDRFLQNEVMHAVDDENSPVAKMTHHVFETSGLDAKKELVQKLASAPDVASCHADQASRQETRANSDRCRIPLSTCTETVSTSQGPKPKGLSDGAVRVLVATDVAARGVHVDNVDLVIHVDPPMEHKAYLHRSGRTARAGAEGDVITICLPTQKGDLAGLLRKADIKVVPVLVTANSPEVLSLVGEIAPYVKPAPREHHHQGGGQSQGKNAQRKRALQGDRPSTHREANPQSRRATRDGQPVRDRSGRPATNSRRQPQRTH